MERGGRRVGAAEMVVLLWLLQSHVLETYLVASHPAAGLRRAGLTKMLFVHKRLDARSPYAGRPLRTCVLRPPGLLHEEGAHGVASLSGADDGARSENAMGPLFGLRRTAPSVWYNQSANSTLAEEHQAETTSVFKTPAEEYEVVRYLGQGKFGNVFEAIARTSSSSSAHDAETAATRVVLKIIKLPVYLRNGTELSAPGSLVDVRRLGDCASKNSSILRVLREVAVLQLLAGKPEILQLRKLLLVPHQKYDNDSLAHHRSLQAKAKEKERKEREAREARAKEKENEKGRRQPELRNQACERAKEALVSDVGEMDCQEARSVVMVFDYLGPATVHLSQRAARHKMSFADIKHYMYLLVRAIRSCHSARVVHRDIKPSNVLVNPVTRRLQVIDFGLAELYEPNKSRSAQVGTKIFNAPELLFGVTTYDYAVDMWSVGCIFASLLFMQDPFFRGHDTLLHMSSIASVCGSREMLRFVRHNNLKLTMNVLRSIGKRPRTPFDEFINSRNRHVFEGVSRSAKSDAFDLLGRLLTVDPSQRICAKEALRHPFFADVAAED